MDQQATASPVTPDNIAVEPPGAAQPTSRRLWLKRGLYGLAGVSGLGGVACYAVRHAADYAPADVFKNDAPPNEVWQLWQARGWLQEARHYVRLGRNVQCKLCPNGCILQPGDRSHCRNRVNRDGKLYTLVYGNPCSLGNDPIEKKPLYHFLPGTAAFSLATSGCGFRCLNCQNWDISQRKPEETKDAQGASIRLNPAYQGPLTRTDMARLSMFPDDVVAMAEKLGCPSIAYTYSEPIVWYEYMIDTARQARRKGIKNLWITCGYIAREALLELCSCLDAANVNLKGFSHDVYRDLNAGKLEPVLQTLKTLKREGVWFEVTNLIVPTYTDKPDMIRQMCRWLVDNLGPDHPLHFSRFHPAHKLTHLSNTPREILLEARQIARDAGLHHVYIGNTPELDGMATTYCPKCAKPVIERIAFTSRPVGLRDGGCASCGTAIAGVWA